MMRGRIRVPWVPSRSFFEDIGFRDLGFGKRNGKKCHIGSHSPRYFVGRETI